MDINERYASKIQHEIAPLKTGKAINATPSQLLIIFEIPDDIERIYASWKDDSENRRIRGCAILARIISYDSGNWQEVCSAEQSMFSFEIKQLEQSRITKRAP